jgi:hypothetical protein
MPKAIRILLVSTFILVIIAGALAYGLYRATKRVPSFYATELEVAPQEQDADRMLRQALNLHNDLQRRCQWQESIEAKTINAWLAVELPRNHSDLLPGGMRDPRVRIGPEGITLACRVDRGWIHGVVSLQVSAFVESADVIGLRVHKIRLGAVPWSLKPVLDGISDAARQSGARIQWRQIEGDPVALLTLTPANGDRNQIVHIDSIRLEEGQLRVAGTTEITK